MFRLLCSVSGRDASSADNFSSSRGAIGSSLIVGLVLAAGLGLAASCQAQILHGDFSGATVDYLMVTESSATDPLPLFGGPTVSGDSLDFTPTNFAATSQLHVPAVDQTDGHLTFMVVPKTGQRIKNINFAESGGITVGGTGTTQSFVDVSMVGGIDIFEVDGVAINKISIPLDMTFSHGNNAGFNDNGEWHLMPQGFINSSWTGNEFVDITAFLQANGFPNALGATKITVALDNKLYAQSEVEATAMIDKKDFFIVTTNIPEPAGCVLALLGMVLGTFVARRSR